MNDCTYGHEAALRRIAELDAALQKLLDSLPRCQLCDLLGLREDCNCLLSCDNDEHACGEDGGAKDLPWGPAARAARAVLAKGGT